MTEFLPEALEGVLAKFLTISDRVNWGRYTDFDWGKVNESTPHPLNKTQIAAVRTALMVEDHIPGYGAEYMRLFAVDDSVGPERAWFNRQMLHFIFRWCSEEDRHAHVLELYLRETRAVQDDDLTAEMVKEGVKKYIAPHEDPVQLFTYTTLQERATQIFYQCLRDNIDEPVLGSVLTRLAQDESRHCAFFGDMVRMALERGGAKVVPLIREAMDAFKMPMANMLDGYRRQSIRMIQAAGGYDYREAFTHFGKVLRDYTKSPTYSRSHTFEDLLRAIAALAPA